MKYRPEINQKIAMQPGAASDATGHRMTARQALEIIIPHVVSTLPDSLNQRSEVLTALSSCLPRGHRCAPLLREMQVHLQVHRLLQDQWTARYAEEYR